MKGYRTYIMGAAIIINQLLIMLDINEYASDEISQALNVILGIGVVLFRKLANTES